MIEIKSITPEDSEEIIDFYETYLNSGEAVRKSISSAFDAGIYYGCKAVSDGKTAGYFSFQDGIALTCPHPELEAELARETAGMKVATVDALMVTKECRGIGIARLMAGQNLKMLKGRGIEAFVVEIWVYPDGSCPAKRIYEKMGRTLFSKEIPMFYKDAHSFGISCPICGTRCSCGAVLEIISVVDEESGE